MQYAFVLYGREAENETPARLTDAERLQWQAFFQDPEVADAVRFRAPLLPSDRAHTVRVREGDAIVTDGPFAETKEQLGGVLVLELQDLDRAIAIAERIPCAEGGSVEIRPVLQPPE